MGYLLKPDIIGHTNSKPPKEHRVTEGLSCSLKLTRQYQYPRVDDGSPFYISEIMTRLVVLTINYSPAEPQGARSSTLRARFQKCPGRQCSRSAFMVFGGSSEPSQRSDMPIPAEPENLVTAPSASSGRLKTRALSDYGILSTQMQTGRKVTLMRRPPKTSFGEFLPQSLLASENSRNEIN